MQPGLLIRLRPLGAWRYGPAEGGHDSVDTLYRSDRLYSAVTLAMQRLSLLDEWLAATAHAAKPAVVFSSLYPFQGDTLYAIPPATLWPPPTGLLHSPSPVFLTKIRWKTARFVPLSVIDSLITGQPILADQWLPDPESGCLLRRDRPSASPFRMVVRSSAAVDRITNNGDESKSVACVEFEPSAGLWTVARFADSASEQTWSPRLQAALRLLSDSGFGGGRSKGWGQTQTAEFQPGSWPGLVLPKLGRHLRTAPAAEPESTAPGLFWLLSLYSPASSDKVDWSGGNYSLAARGGRVESNAGSGSVKRTVRMVNEGCVLASHEEPVGTTVDVAPDGFAHPVYRSGLALALRLPVVEIQPAEPRTSVSGLPPDTDEPPAPEEPPTPTIAEEPLSEPQPPSEPQPLSEPRTLVSGLPPSPISPVENHDPHEPQEPHEPQPPHEPAEPPTPEIEDVPPPEPVADVEPPSPPVEPTKHEEPPHEI